MKDQNKPTEYNYQETQKKKGISIGAAIILGISGIIIAALLAGAIIFASGAKTIRDLGLEVEDLDGFDVRVDDKGKKTRIQFSINDQKSDFIQVTSPKEGALIESPVVIEGEARGTWFFEADFPVILVDWDGKIIGEAIATAQDDWMTEDFVPFKATLNFDFDQDSYSNKGTLIFKKDNPSGLPEHDDAFELDVVIE